MRVQLFNKYKKLIDNAHWVKRAKEVDGFEILADGNNVNYHIIITHKRVYLDDVEINISDSVAGTLNYYCYLINNDNRDKEKNEKEKLMEGLLG